MPWHGEAGLRLDQLQSESPELHATRQAGGYTGMTLELSCFSFSEQHRRRKAKTPCESMAGRSGHREACPAGDLGAAL